MRYARWHGEVSRTQPTQSRIAPAMRRDATIPPEIMVLFGNDADFPDGR